MLFDAMEFGLRPLGFMELLHNNNQAVNKMMIAVLKKIHETQGSQTKFHGIKKNIYIFIIFTSE